MSGYAKLVSRPAAGDIVYFKAGGRGQSMCHGYVSDHTLDGLPEHAGLDDESVVVYVPRVAWPPKAAPGVNVHTKLTRIGDTVFRVFDWKSSLTSNPGLAQKLKPTGDARTWQFAQLAFVLVDLSDALPFSCVTGGPDVWAQSVSRCRDAQSYADLKKELLWMHSAIRDDSFLPYKLLKRRDWESDCQKADTAPKLWKAFQELEDSINWDYTHRKFSDDISTIGEEALKQHGAELYGRAAAQPAKQTASAAPSGATAAATAQAAPKSGVVGSLAQHGTSSEGGIKGAGGKASAQLGKKAAAAPAASAGKGQGLKRPASSSALDSNGSDGAAAKRLKASAGGGSAGGQGSQSVSAGAAATKLSAGAASGKAVAKPDDVGMLNVRKSNGPVAGAGQNFASGATLAAQGPQPAPNPRVVQLNSELAETRLEAAAAAAAAAAAPAPVLSAHAARLPGRAHRLPARQNPAGGAAPAAAAAASAATAAAAPIGAEGANEEVDEDEEAAPLALINAHLGDIAADAADGQRLERRRFALRFESIPGDPCTTPGTEAGHDSLQRLVSLCPAESCTLEEAQAKRAEAKKTIADLGEEQKLALFQTVRDLLESRGASQTGFTPEGECRFCHLPPVPPGPDRSESLCGLRMRPVALCCGVAWNDCACKLEEDAQQGGNTVKRKGWVHHDCALYSPQVVMNGAVKLVVHKKGVQGELSLPAEVTRAAHFGCTVCHARNASIECADFHCRAFFHLPCAMEVCAIGSEGNSALGMYRVLCGKHTNARRLGDLRSPHAEQIRDFRLLAAARAAGGAGAGASGASGAGGRGDGLAAGHGGARKRGKGGRFGRRAGQPREAAGAAAPAQDPTPRAAATSAAAAAAPVAGAALLSMPPIVPKNADAYLEEAIAVGAAMLSQGGVLPRAVPRPPPGKVPGPPAGGVNFRAKLADAAAPPAPAPAPRPPPHPLGDAAGAGAAPRAVLPAAQPAVQPAPAPAPPHAAAAAALGAHAVHNAAPAAAAALAAFHDVPDLRPFNRPAVKRKTNAPGPPTPVSPSLEGRSGLRQSGAGLSDVSMGPDAREAAPEGGAVAPGDSAQGGAGALPVATPGLPLTAQGGAAAAPRHPSTSPPRQTLPNAQSRVGLAGGDADASAAHHFTEETAAGPRPHSSGGSADSEPAEGSVSYSGSEELEAEAAACAAGAAGEAAAVAAAGAPGFSGGASDRDSDVAASDGAEGPLDELDGLTSDILGGGDDDGNNDGDSDLDDLPTGTGRRSSSGGGWVSDPDADGHNPVALASSSGADRASGEAGGAAAPSAVIAPAPSRPSGPKKRKFSREASSLAPSVGFAAAAAGARGSESGGSSDAEEPRLKRPGKAPMASSPAEGVGAAAAVGTYVDPAVREDLVLISNDISVDMASVNHRGGAGSAADPEPEPVRLFVTKERYERLGDGHEQIGAIIGDLKRAAPGPERDKAEEALRECRRLCCFDEIGFEYIRSPLDVCDAVKQAAQYAMETTGALATCSCVGRCGPFSLDSGRPCCAHIAHSFEDIGNPDMVTDQCPITGELRGHKAFYSDMGTCQVRYDEKGRSRNVLHECGTWCACDQDCPNRVLQHGVRQPLDVLPAGGSGFGVFARRDIPARTFIVEYIGERITDGEAEKRGRAATGNDEYLYNIDTYLVTAEGEGTAGGKRRGKPPAKPPGELFVLDARMFGNVARFINHSCEPNCVIFSVFFEHLAPQLARIALFSERDIKAGEQLSYNYRYVNNHEVECRCGAAKCRKWLR